MTTDAQFVTNWFQSVQYRDAPLDRVNGYVADISRMAMTLDKARSYILSDNYTVQYNDPILRLYQAALDRVPDHDGYNFWSDIVAANPSALDNLADAFTNSPEFQSRYGTNGSAIVNQNIVTIFYQNIMERGPDAAGLQFWANSGITVRQLIQSFVNSPEYLNKTSDSIVNYHNAQMAGEEAHTGTLYQYAQKDLWLFDSESALSGATVKADDIGRDHIVVFQSGSVTDNDLVNVFKVEGIRFNNDAANVLALGANATRSGMQYVTGGDGADIIRLNSAAYQLSGVLEGRGGADTLIGSSQVDQFIYSSSTDTGSVRYWSKTNPASISTIGLDKIFATAGDQVIIDVGQNSLGNYSSFRTVIDGSAASIEVGAVSSMRTYTGIYANNTFTTSAKADANSLLFVWDADGRGPETTMDSIVIVGANTIADTLPNGILIGGLI